MSTEVNYISNICVMGKKITPQFKCELAPLIYNNSSCLMVRGITRIWSKTSVQLFLNFICHHLLILTTVAGKDKTPAKLNKMPPNLIKMYANFINCTHANLKKCMQT